MKPFRVVRSITALPSPAKSGTRELMLRVDAQPTLPGRPPASIVVPSGDVKISSPLFERIEKLSVAESIEARRRLDKLHESKKTRIMTFPFREAGYFTWRLFRALRTMLSAEQSVYLRVKGRNGVWKLNQNAAWALDGGKAIDRLIKNTL